MALRINKQKNNKSGFTGVYYRKERRVWVALIQSREFHLKITKHFDSPEKAYTWRQEYLETRPELVANPRPHCWKCDKTKELTEFHKERKRPRGVMNICKECSKIKGKIQYARKKHLTV